MVGFIGTFKDYLLESAEDGVDSVSNLFKFQVTEFKILERLAGVIGEDDNITVEFIAVIQMMKQAIIDNIDDPDLIQALRDDTKAALKLMYPKANTTELYRILDKVMISAIEKSSVAKIKESIDLLDLTIDSNDEFGRLLKRVYRKELRDTLDTDDSSIVKQWADKIYKGDAEMKSKIRKRLQQKSRMYDRLDGTPEVEDIDDEIIDDIEDGVDTEEKESFFKR